MHFLHVLNHRVFFVHFRLLLRRKPSPQPPTRPLQQRQLTNRKLQLLVGKAELEERQSPMLASLAKTKVRFLMLSQLFDSGCWRYLKPLAWTDFETDSLFDVVLSEQLELRVLCFARSLDFCCANLSLLPAEEEEDEQSESAAPAPAAAAAPAATATPANGSAPAAAAEAPKAESKESKDKGGKGKKGKDKKKGPAPKGNLLNFLVCHIAWSDCDCVQLLSSLSLCPLFCFDVN